MCNIIPPPGGSGSDKPVVIALYLPQFHPTEDNDKWYGDGFTEWTNVRKAKPLFKGHYQPRIPGELGYYDLRDPQTRLAQADMAREHGVDALCYYHYWFGEGKRELELPFNEVLKLGEPDFPFCLCWANESWHAKFWNTDGTVSKRMLVEQRYPGEKDIIEHFYSLLPAFRDRRYFKYEGRNVFMIYKPFLHPDLKGFIRIWRELSKKEGIDDFYFIGHDQDNIPKVKRETLLSKGIDAVNVNMLHGAPLKFDASRRAGESKLHERLRWAKEAIIRRIHPTPNRWKYEDLYPYFCNDAMKEETVIPSIIPNWDHSPRSGKAAYVITDSTPELFGKHLAQVKAVLNDKQNKIVVLKSWNEWGEGNYVEPDQVYGDSYLKEIKKFVGD